MTRQLQSLILAFALFFSSLSLAQPPAEHPHRLALSAGELGLGDDLQRPGRYGISYFARPFTSWKLIPGIGFIWTDEDAHFTYALVRRDFWLGDHWVLTPSFGAGLFEEGDELRLGHEVEFRSGLEINYSFANQIRLGAGFFHVSNAGIGENNPGTESAVVVFSVPLP